jgi:hypothetical protein
MLCSVHAVLFRLFYIQLQFKLNRFNTLINFKKRSWQLFKAKKRNTESAEEFIPGFICYFTLGVQAFNQI